MKNQKGVSLITLVITIIVVIILAAIALGGGAADTAGQAQFSGFATEMGGLQESVETAIVTAKGSEGIRGMQRTNEQLANYVARGGADVMPANDSGDATWLVQADAKAIPCTLINKAYAEKVLGKTLPVRKVETDQGTNQEVSYFVTPKGQVFCWPPYTYDDKSYVTNKVTAKKGVTGSGDYNNAEEYKGTEATATTESVTLYFPDTDEIVKVSNAAGTDVAFDKGDGTTAKGNASVFYSAQKSQSDSKSNSISGVSYTLSSGVATGLTFDSYKNN